MNFTIRWKGLKKSEELEEYLRHRAEFAFDRISARIRRVAVRFEDLNGPRGGVDKSCRVEITGDFGTSAAEARDLDFRVATDRALEMVARSTMRILRRPIGLRNDPIKEFGDDSESLNHPAK